MKIESFMAGLSAAFALVYGWMIKGLYEVEQRQAANINLASPPVEHAMPIILVAGLVVFAGLVAGFIELAIKEEEECEKP